MSRDPHQPMNPWPQTSVVRQGLDALLAMFPFYDVVRLDWQIDLADERFARRWAGPWILVNLGQPSDLIGVEPAWAVHRFAIWRATGNVYEVGHDGAVSDDPIIDLAQVIR